MSDRLRYGGLYGPTDRMANYICRKCGGSVNLCRCDAFHSLTDGSVNWLAQSGHDLGLACRCGGLGCVACLAMRLTGKNEYQRGR